MGSNPRLSCFILMVIVRITVTFGNFLPSKREESRVPH